MDTSAATREGSQAGGNGLAATRDLAATREVGSGFEATRTAGSGFAARRSGRGSEDGLSAREVEVLRLIALGYTSAEVARQLQLSPRTVETHRARINRKLGMSKRADLVRYALRRGLLGV